MKSTVASVKVIPKLNSPIFHRFNLADGAECVAEMMDLLMHDDG